ncbi:MAG TPA: ZIP family metal transporter [Candidatus Sulfotelmatobacter sp.]|nr:ZIP family metal transporter [Candidatus Sulfotelmatobacter sp.]
MSFAGTAALGAIAGLTIFLGIPVARLGRPSRNRMAFLNAASIGVLLFILYDVLRNAADPIESAMDGSRSLGTWYALLLAAGLAVGLLGLVGYERLTLRRRPHTEQLPDGPGAALAASEVRPVGSLGLEGPYRVAFFIAVGIGLHNFSEGLAIGQSAAGGAYRFFLLLVIGFGLHNITEGFGVTAPLIGQRPSWRFLGLCGLVGGGPTFIGSMLGFKLSSPALSILFLALAAGAIIYVIGELQHAGRKIGSHDVAMLGLLTGFLAAYGTDLFLHVVGS